jgi:methylaspartate ammonia-lyase
VDAVETLVLVNTSTTPSLPIVVVYAGETAGCGDTFYVRDAVSACARDLIAPRIIGRDAAEVESI